MSRERLYEALSKDGNLHHKRVPVDYGFHPPASPRRNTSQCDANRCVHLDEARAMFREAIDHGMTSTYRIDDRPRYLWAVGAERTPLILHRSYPKLCNARATLVEFVW